MAVEPPAHTKLNPGRRNEAVQKVVDEPRNAVHNLASLLLKTQRCWETPGFPQKCSLKINSR
ncbi:hypothetical protein WS51_12055 [Burkholderia territorii]|uniref:Uncharacterized protein n=1 Tax=Burkholderia territorii TaxID=1503055 RepID=A0AAC9DPY3_9BURK|nr:hypothetical protein WS51_12055 [Burkholderia territorii]